MNYLDITELPELADRLGYAMEQRGIVQERLAEATGCSQATIQKLASGKSKKSRFIAAIARALQVDVDWLELGIMPQTGKVDRTHKLPTDGTPIKLGELSTWDDTTPLEEDEVALPLYKEVEIASGAGRTTVQVDEGRKVRFSRYTLRKAGIDPKSAACATNSGNSNHPLILDKATIGIDKGMTRIVDGQLYALDHDGLLRVKFLYRLPSGSIRLRSFNRDEYADEDYTLDQVMEQRIQIIGRVFWWSTINPVNAKLL